MYVCGVADQQFIKGFHNDTLTKYFGHPMSECPDMPWLIEDNWKKSDNELATILHEKFESRNLTQHSHDKEDEVHQMFLKLVQDLRWRHHQRLSNE